MTLVFHWGCQSTPEISGVDLGGRLLLIGDFGAHFVWSSEVFCKVLVCKTFLKKTGLFGAQNMKEKNRAKLQKHGWKKFEASFSRFYQSLASMKQTVRPWKSPSFLENTIQNGGLSMKYVSLQECKMFFFQFDFYASDGLKPPTSINLLNVLFFWGCVSFLFFFAKGMKWKPQPLWLRHGGSRAEIGKRPGDLFKVAKVWSPNWRSLFTP